MNEIDSLFDSYDPGDEDEDNLSFHSTCKYCGARNLAWIDFDNKWKLVDKKHKVHACKARTLTTNINMDDTLE